MNCPARPHRPRKRFGQHFLRDPAVQRRIVDSFNPQPEQHVVEIGPGQGALTTLLLGRLPRLHAVELDRDLVAALASRFDSSRLQLHQHDVLDFDFSRLAEETGDELRLIGNLPYNISSPLLFHLLQQRAAIQDMLFMLQKEVVERLTAEPGNRRYGRLTVMAGLDLESEKLFDVSAEAFSPAPKVDSSVVRLWPRQAPLPLRNRKIFGQVVFQAFSQRRKTLRNALKVVADRALIESADIDPGNRAEGLSIADYVRLANVISNPATDSDQSSSIS